MVLLMLLVTVMPAQSASYKFPDALPAGCTVDHSSINTYSCGVLTLVDGDTVTIMTGGGSLTINFSGALTTGAGTNINLGGNVADLNLVLAGVLTLGDASTLIANVTTSAAVNLGAGSVVGGTVITNTPAGVVTTGDSSKVGGAINASEGAVTIGANSSVLDHITANVGVVTIGDSSQINGDITAGVGAVNIGLSSTINGDINAGVGAVDIGTNSAVHGNINADVGAVTIGDGSMIDGDILGGVGAVTTGTNVNVGGLLTPRDIITTDGVITIGTGNIIGGNVSSGAGAVTVGDSTNIFGTVSSDVGAVTVTTSAVVCGTVSSASEILSNSLVSPQCPTVSVNTLFDCLETSSHSPALYTKLAATPFTFDIIALKDDKTIKSNYVVARGITKYVKVELFDDTTPVANCASYINPLAAQTVAFIRNLPVPGRVLTGYFDLGNAAYAKLRCRVTECTDSNCNGFTEQQSCSSDQFSVRPTTLMLTSEANANAASLSLETEKPTIKAGANFTLSTNMTSYSGVLLPNINVQNTVENPSVEVIGKVGELMSTSSNRLIFNNGVSNSTTYSEVGYLYLASGAYYDSNFTGVDRVNNDCIANSLSNDLDASSKYGCNFETSAVSLGRFIPDHFGVVGAVVTRSDISATQPHVGSPFTYMDEPMQLALTVTAYNKNQGVTFNYQGKFAKFNTTDWISEDLSNWTCTELQCMGLSAASGTTLLTDRLAIDTTSVNSQIPSNTKTLGGNGWGDGSSHFMVNIKVLRKLNADGQVNPDGPYDALILGAKPQDSDGVTLLTNSLTHIPCVAHNEVTGIEDPNCEIVDVNNAQVGIIKTKVRFGRLSIGNAYGSKFLDLSIPVEAQFWSGSSFLRNDLDSYTPLAKNNMTVSSLQEELAGVIPAFGRVDANDRCVINDVTKNGVMIKGESCILFSNSSVSGSVDLLVNLGGAGAPAICPVPSGATESFNPENMAYLRGNWCSGNYDRDPTAHITFGIYKDNSKVGNHLIYFREIN
jgi:hypothetical protein